MYQGAVGALLRLLADGGLEGAAHHVPLHTIEGVVHGGAHEARQHEAQGAWMAVTVKQLVGVQLGAIQCPNWSEPPKMGQRTGWEEEQWINGVFTQCCIV